LAANDCTNLCRRAILGYDFAYDLGLDAVDDPIANPRDKVAIGKNADTVLGVVNDSPGILSLTNLSLELLLQVFISARAVTCMNSTFRCRVSMIDRRREQQRQL
jgi:hypothetical protein